MAVVLHTLESDWAKQQIAGMVGIFGDCGAAVIDVVDCGFSPERQVAELDRLIALHPDAIISLPVANEPVAAALAVPVPDAAPVPAALPVEAAVEAPTADAVPAPAELPAMHLPSCCSTAPPSTRPCRKAWRTGIGCWG